MTALVVSAVLMLSLTMVQSTSVMASLSQENPYAIGAPILALKLTRMQMLTSTVGVGVAPITTLGGALVRAYLVRTSDAGATWTVSGDLPNGVYPWTTAFSTVRDGYVISAGATLFTNDGGRTWSRVAIAGGAIAVTIHNAVVWFEMERCPKGAKNATCHTYLDATHVGDLVANTTYEVPTDQPVITQDSATSGFSIGDDGAMTRVFATNDAGATWRVVSSPCTSHTTPDGSVAAPTMLLSYCTTKSAQGAATTTLFTSSDAGATWHRAFNVARTGVGAVVGNTGEYLWNLSGGTLVESSDAGRTWVDQPIVKYGTNGVVVTFGAHDAWHVVTGRGIYRTLDGTDWTLLK